MLEQILRDRSDSYATEGFQDLLCFEPGCARPAGPISVKNELPVAELDRNEKMLAGGWSPPSGGRYSLVRILTLVDRFYKAEARLPVDGIELLSWHLAATRTPEQIQALADLPPDVMFGILAPVINPATGRPYESLNSNTWHQYGAYIGPDDSPEVFTATLGVRPERYSELRPGEALPKLWRIRVFGSERNETVTDKIIIVKQPGHQTVANTAGGETTAPCESCP